MSQPVVEFKSVEMDFPPTRALAGITFQLKPGTTLGLLGANGAGKSTCLKLLIGMLRPTAGSVQVFGESSHQRSHNIRQHVGYVPDEPALYPWMTVRQLIDFVAPMYERWDHDFAARLVRDFQLPLDRKLATFSKGMRVKGALLVALAHHPRLLVMDEPLAGLDPLARDELVSLVVQAKSQQTECVVISSHQVDELVRLSDRIAILNQGRMLIEGQVETLLKEAKRIEAVLLDGCLPTHELPQTRWQYINRREWSMMVYPYAASMLDELQQNNRIASVSVHDIGIEQIMKDAIRGDQLSCSDH